MNLLLDPFSVSHFHYVLLTQNLHLKALMILLLSSIEADYEQLMGSVCSSVHWWCIKWCYEVTKDSTCQIWKVQEHLPYHFLITFSKSYMTFFKFDPKFQ